MSSLLSPSRRALVDKTTNAQVRKQSTTKHVKTAEPPSILLATSLNNRVSQTEIAKSTRAGQKRSIEEVEDVERSERLEEGSQGSNSTQTLSLLSEGDSLNLLDDSRTTNATSALSFGPSQPEAPPIETTFEILEDMSQNTCDQLVSEALVRSGLCTDWLQHAVNLPQNASQPQGLKPLMTTQLSQVSVGMSSFIDFDQSQTDKSDGLQPLKQDYGSTEAEAQNPPVQAVKTRREQVDAQADRLRMRLQLALYKVRTNQTTTPFNRLRHQSRSKSPPAVQQPPYSSSPPSSPAEPKCPSPESRIAMMRTMAAMQQKQTVNPLHSMPMPVIKPTAFSSRQMDQEPQQMPSSPPDSRQASAEGDDTPRPLKTNVIPPHTPMQLSSPPGSPERRKSNMATTAEKLKRQDRGQNYHRLTSSVIKGDAANSLLELMKGASSE